MARLQQDVGLTILCFGHMTVNVLLKFWDIFGAKDLLSLALGAATGLGDCKMLLKFIAGIMNSVLQFHIMIGRVLESRRFQFISQGVQLSTQLSKGRYQMLQIWVFGGIVAVRRDGEAVIANIFQIFRGEIEGRHGIRCNGRRECDTIVHSVISHTGAQPWTRWLKFLHLRYESDALVTRRKRRWITRQNYRQADPMTT